jgi:hypothetical protein
MISQFLILFVVVIGLQVLVVYVISKKLHKPMLFRKVLISMIPNAIALAVGYVIGQLLK